VKLRQREEPQPGAGAKQEGESQPEGEAGPAEVSEPGVSAVCGGWESALQSMAEHLARAAAALGLGGEAVSAKALEVQVAPGGAAGKEEGGGGGGREEGREGREGGGQWRGREAAPARGQSSGRSIGDAQESTVCVCGREGRPTLAPRPRLLPPPSLTVLDPFREQFYSFPSTPHATPSVRR